MSHAGIKRIALNYLTPSSSDFLLVGVIIAKRPPRYFSSKRDGSKRGVMGFTLRDSPADYINVTVWGSPSFIEKMSSTYRVGDVVDLINTKVEMRKPGYKDDDFQPPVTSCMELMFNEGESKMNLHDLEDSLDYVKLLHLPTKPPANFLNLIDIKTNGKMFDGQSVNVMVAVQKIGTRRDMMSRNGKPLSVLEVTILDKTSSDFMLQIWEEDMIQRALQWLPRDTTLFLSDIRVSWSTYRKAMVASLTSRSIVTENPTTREAIALSSFVKSLPLDNAAFADTIATNLPNPETIVNIMSCSAVIGQSWSRQCSESFTVLLYAVLHRLDIDGDNSSFIINKCVRCQTIVPPACRSCPKQDCPDNSLISAYNLRITLVDHTGRLAGCRLTGTVAANILGYKAEEFLQLSQCQKTSIKWAWLLKKVAARLLILPVAPDRLSPNIFLIHLKTVPWEEYADKSPVF